MTKQSLIPACNSEPLATGLQILTKPAGRTNLDDFAVRRRQEKRLLRGAGVNYKQQGLISPVAYPLRNACAQCDEHRVQGAGSGYRFDEYHVQTKRLQERAWGSSVRSFVPTASSTRWQKLAVRPCRQRGLWLRAKVSRQVHGQEPYNPRLHSLTDPKLSPTAGPYCLVEMQHAGHE